MNLYFHGGMCCGIKTIAGFHGDPEWSVGTREKRPVDDTDAEGGGVSTSEPFFTDEAPKETQLERLDRLIAFCKRRRPAGVIEVALARDSESCFDQITQWEKHLLERGFKNYVPDFENSNSGSLIRIYHLVYKGPGYVYSDPDDEYDDPFDFDEEE